MTMISTTKSSADKRVALAKAFARRISEKAWQPEHFEPDCEQPEGETGSATGSRFLLGTPGLAPARAAA